MVLKRLLLVTYHFPPQAASGSFRLLGFARHLPRTGWQPVVLAPPAVPWEPTDAALGAEVPAETEVRAVPYPVGAPRLLRALMPQALWLPRALAACRAAVRELRPDAVLTSGPPHWVHLLGLALRRGSGLPWVADFRDPWVAGLPRGAQGLRRRWERYWEGKVIAGADAVLANAPNACRLLQTAYPAHAAKVVTLTNGFDPAEGPLPAPAADGVVRLVHAGELYGGRDPVPLLDALAAWNAGDGAPGRRARLEVIGRSYLPVDLAEEIARRGLQEDVVQTGQLPYRAALTAMAKASILVLFDTPGRTIGVPAKLYEYFGAGRPILALAEPDGDVANVLRASGVLHRLASPRDAGQIQQALGDLVRAMAEPDAPGGSARLQRYTRAHLAGELAELLDRLSLASGATAQILATRLPVPKRHALELGPTSSSGASGRG